METANLENEGDGVNTYLTIDETVKIEPPDLSCSPDHPEPGIWFDFPATAEAIAALTAGRATRIELPDGHTCDGIVSSTPECIDGMLSVHLTNIQWSKADR